ncbi:hypothetical protein GOBAR_DD21906 [Gossypium barbadense]|nr:hypothetical protein GOBAR_DD21906 [Gossypium barbadense]
MEKGIEKLKRILAGEKETPFTSREYMTLYTTIYNMCNQKAPHDYSEQLYDKYKKTLDEYITSIKVQHELLVVYVNQLLEKEDSGIKVLFRDDKVDDLSRTYRVYNKISQGLDLVANVFKQHVTIEGTAFVQQAEEATSNQASNTPGGHEQALKEAFEVFCNKTVNGSPSAEILASFADHILRKGGSEKLSDEVIEETLEKVVKLLQYVIDKDVFAEFYRKKLARRLLFDRGTNDDHERSILSKLKQQFGAPLTSKMEGMVTDVVLAKEHQSSFQEYLRNNPDVHPGLDFTVTVLTTGFWPSYKWFDLSLPSEMVKCVKVFKGFYETKTKHRKLTWIFSLGTSHINGKFEPKPIELIVSTHQAAVLLLFNASERLSYSEIVAQLNLAHDDLIRLLHSLSCAKYKILNKEPSSKSISQSDSFKFNPNFTDKMRRIKVPLPPVDERKKVIEDVDKDRPYAIDAAIVRIMKSRKVIIHQQLISETIEQLSRMFKLDLKAEFTKQVRLVDALLVKFPLDTST